MDAGIGSLLGSGKGWKVWPLPGWAPNVQKDVMECWIVQLEFGPYEWEEIVTVKISLRALSKVFLVIGQTVVFHRLPRV